MGRRPIETIQSFLDSVKKETKSTNDHIMINPRQPECDMGTCVEVVGL